MVMLDLHRQHGAQLSSTWCTCEAQFFAGLSLIVRVSFWLKKAHAAQEVPKHVMLVSGQYPRK